RSSPVYTGCSLRAALGPLLATVVSRQTPSVPRSVNRIICPALSQVGCARLTLLLVLVSTITSLPSARAVAMLPSPSTYTHRDPSGDHEGSVTVDPNRTGWPPTMTVEVPFATVGTLAL